MRIFLFWCLLFSVSVAKAANVCDPNSPLMNKLMSEADLKKELKNLGDQGVGYIKDSLFYNYQDQVDRSAPCKEVLDELRQAQNIQSVLLTGFSCLPQTFSFNVPGFISGDHVATNRHTQHGVYGEAHKSTGQVAVGKIMSVKLNRDVQQMRIEGLSDGAGKAYQYDDKGAITHEIAYVQEGNQFRLSCAPIAKKMDETVWQLNHTLPTMKIFAKRGICHTGCGAEVKAMIQKNLEEIAKSGRSSVPVGKVEGDPKCTRWMDQAKRDGCMPKEVLANFKELPATGSVRNIRPKCGLALDVGLQDCDSKSCNYIASKNATDGCLSHPLLTLFSEKKCPRPLSGKHPTLCTEIIPDALIPVVNGAGATR